MNAPLHRRAPTRSEARIGPNSVLQLIPVLDEVLGHPERERLMHLSGLAELPTSEGLMAEAPAAMLHQALRQHHPELAPQLTRRAGERTADFLIRHRIPIAAIHVIKSLPPWLGAPVLASVIAKHSWTFAGSGVFKIRARHPLVFDLVDNPVVRGEHAEAPVCCWHAAVFERLFSAIVDPDMHCVETHCCAVGAKNCRFEIS